jgi:hypothetical protein
MSGGSSLRAILEPHLSVERCTAEFVDLVRIPSPQTAMMEAEPALRRFIETAVEPRLRALGFDNCRYDQMGNLIADMGPSGGRSLMLVSHAMNQPPTTMANPYTGEIVDGAPFGLVGKGRTRAWCQRAEGHLGGHVACNGSGSARRHSVGRTPYICVLRVR